VEKGQAAGGAYLCPWRWPRAKGVFSLWLRREALLVRTEVAEAIKKTSCQGMVRQTTLLV